MSLYSFVQFGDVTLPTGGAANVTGSQMSVRVEEEQMLLLLRFQGRLTGVTAELVTLNFAVDSGAGFVAASVLPLASHTYLTGQLAHEFHVELPVVLTKGEHKVALLANAASGNHQIDGLTVNSRFSATRVSSDATLGQGVNSKVQLSL